MCVRTLTENEIETVPGNITIYKEVKNEESKTSNKLQKMKEKFIKLHDKMIIRERKHRSDYEQKDNNNILVPVITEAVLFNFTVKFRTFFNNFLSRYGALKHSKSYR